MPLGTVGWCWMPLDGVGCWGGVGYYWMPLDGVGGTKDCTMDSECLVPLQPCHATGVVWSGVVLWCGVVWCVGVPMYCIHRYCSGGFDGMATKIQGRCHNSAIIGASQVVRYEDVASKTRSDLQTLFGGLKLINEHAELIISFLDGTAFFPIATVRLTTLWGVVWYTAAHHGHIITPWAHHHTIGTPLHHGTPSHHKVNFEHHN